MIRKVECTAGQEAHDAHMDLNGECPTCGAGLNLVDGEILEIPAVEEVKASKPEKLENVTKKMVLDLLAENTVAPNTAENRRIVRKTAAWEINEMGWRFAEGMIQGGEEIPTMEGLTQKVLARLVATA